MATNWQLYRHYWAFYWPLALTACFLLLGLQVFNAVLARYPNAERELAVFAYAISFIHFLEVATAFMPQMVMVYGRTQVARRRVLYFCLGIGLLFSAIACLLGVTDWGNRLVAIAYGIEADILNEVVRYLAWLFPTILFRTLFHYFAGILTQNDKTRLVSLSTFVGVGLGVVICLYGYRSGWSAFATLVSAQLSASLGMLLGSIVAYVRYYRGVEEVDFCDPDYRDLFRYFWPVSVTGMSFGIGRPVIYAFVSRTPDALLTIAALRVGLDFFMIAQAALNQLRSLLPSLGLTHLREKKRFIMAVTSGFTLFMACLVFTPLDRLVLQQGLGLNADLFLYVKQTLTVILFTPAILAIRNYYHGILLTKKQTGGIAMGSALRISAILLSCWLLLSLGWLNSWTAPLVMVLGFLAETLVIWLLSRRSLSA